MEFLSVVMGVGLSAACGFRIFVPFLILSLTASNGYVKLAPGFEWIGTNPALICFSVATAVEILSYFIPFVDNFLDAVASPFAVAAGIVLSASCISGIDPYLKWTLTIIAGGAAAGLTQTATASARLASTTSTGGLFNFVIALIEAAGSFFLSVIAIFLPFMCIGLAAAFVIYVRVRFRKRAALPGRVDAM